MGKRIRAQRKGSSPRYRVASHRFPGANRMPRAEGVVGEITELLHSPVPVSYTHLTLPTILLV